MEYLIISASLNKTSRSFVLSQSALEVFKQYRRQAELIDLRNYQLPLCDGGETFNHPHVKQIKQKIEKASALIVAGPIYNYEMNASLKNLFDLTGSAWEGKIIGLMAVGGGRNSYMAPMNFLNSLMFNARCLIVPRYVYALENQISETQPLPTEITKRINELVETTIRLAEKLLA